MATTTTSRTVTIPRMRGSKWLTEATYISDATVTAILAKVDECKRAYPWLAATVGVRPSAYIGPDMPAVADVTYGGPGGSCLFGSVNHCRES